MGLSTLYLISNCTFCLVAYFVMISICEIILVFYSHYLLSKLEQIYFNKFDLVIVSLLNREVC